MLRSQHPLRAIRFFHQLDLYPIIFVPPSTLKDPDPESGLLASEYLYTFLSSRVSLPEHLHKIRASINEAEKAHLFLAADLLPFKSLIYLEKKKEVPVTRYIIKDSLKLSNSEADFACALLNDLDSIAEVVQAVANGRESRVQIGKWSFPTPLHCFRLLMSHPFVQAFSFAKLVPALCLTAGLLPSSWAWWLK